MMIRWFFVAVLCCIFFIPQGLLGADGDRLLKIVALSRHGVRSPTQDALILSYWSQKNWPDWPVAKGELTPRGAQLVTAMWSQLVPRLTRLGILSKDMCANPSDIYVRADVDERTKATARAILTGLAPNCRLGFSVLANATVDPLFHPMKAGLYRFNPVSAATDVLSMTNGGLDALEDHFSSQVALVGNILGTPAPMLCSRFAMVPDCQLSDLPNAISLSPDGTDIKLVGALSIASSAAEIFLLEYAQWPGEAAGWGNVNEKTLQQILPVHARIFDVINRAPVVAWAKGSSLLTEMSAALLGHHYDDACNKAKLVVFVGHDTNIANIGALLKLNWQARDYPANGIPPAGVLFLELWERGGKKEVTARFYAQTLQTLHSRFRENQQDMVNMAEFAAVGVDVSSPPVIGEARFDPESFITLVSRVTEGAPMSPLEKPVLDYNVVEPKK